MADHNTPVSSVHSMASLVTYGHENSDDEHDIQHEVKKESPEFLVPIKKSVTSPPFKIASPKDIVKEVKLIMEEKVEILEVINAPLDEASFTIGDPFSDDEAGHSPKKEHSPRKSKPIKKSFIEAPPLKKPKNTGDVVLVSYGVHEDDEDEDGSRSHRKLSESHTPNNSDPEKLDDDDMDVVASDQEDSVKMETEVLQDNAKEASPDAANKSDSESTFNKFNPKLEQELEKKRREDNMEASSLSRVMQTLKPEEICIPREPPGQCSKELQDRVREYVRRTRFTDFDLNKQIQDRKDFRNSSIYEKLVAYLDIDEKGTNFPQDIYDPYRWGPESFYEDLAKSQNKEIEKKEKEKKEQRKVEFVSGSKSNSSSTSNLQKTESEPKKRSKWDTKPSIPTAVSVQPQATDNQPAVKSTTIIPAVGTLSKKKSVK